MKRARRAYTMIEVMCGLAVLTVGAAGVIAMQKAAQIANTNARMLATANALASTWVERIQADAMQWNTTADLSDTTWVQEVSTSNGAFINPTVVNGSATNAADLLGADIFPADTTPVAFCTHVALFQLSDDMIGVTVRTVWIRGGVAMENKHGTRAGLGAHCENDPSVVDDDIANNTDPVGFGAVYVTTAVVRNVLGAQ